MLFKAKLYLTQNVSSAEVEKSSSNQNGDAIRFEVWGRWREEMGPGAWWEGSVQKKANSQFSV